MASPLPFAHPADLVRADQKELLGGHAARWQGALQVLGDASYAWATAAAWLGQLLYLKAAGSSLGEEYSELLLVENLRPAGRFRRLLAAALNAVLVNGNWGEWLMLFLRLHLALFYLFGRYRHLPERLLNLRAVSLAERPYRSFSYRPLGFVLLAQAIGQLLAKILQRRQRSGADVADTETLQAAMGNWAPALPQSRLSAGRPPRCNICAGEKCGLFGGGELSLGSRRIMRVHVLDYDTPEGAKRLRSKALILTAPSYVTASLLKEVCPAAASALEGIRYPRVAAVTVAYSHLEHLLLLYNTKSASLMSGKGIVNGFGQLHPRSQGIRTLGTIYSSSLFPNRMPDDDKIMLLHYIGGARDPELFGGIQGLTEGQLVEATHKDTVETMLHPSEASNLPKALGVRVWDRAIPQLEVGHQDRLDTVKKSLGIEGVEGLYLAGNFVGGVALGRCSLLRLECSGGE
ncbi:unnamed protein product [Durusdinium trenchii]|uniref:Protoporphyrinogen oxidase n=1 Tax=Durusdinium trenchii TaxID=1381693 RepID=A0ABP0MHA3_9DINO